MNDDEKVCGNCRFWVTDGDEAGSATVIAARLTH